jgi:hypothetical protein
MAEFLVSREMRTTVAMKAEVTAGTDVIAGQPAAVNVVPYIVGTLTLQREPAEIQNRMTAGNLGRAPSLQGPSIGILRFSMYPRGAGAAYSGSVLPEMDPALRACRLTKTVVTTTGAETVEYKPSSSDEVFTIYVQHDIPSANALTWKMVGCVGTCRFRGTAGGPMVAEFTMLGALSRADVAYRAGTLAVTPQYPTLKSAAFQIGTSNYAPRIKEIVFDLGNVPERIWSINSASGIVGFFTADRAPMWQIDPEADTEANSAWWTALQSGTLNDLSYTLGSTQYDRMKIRGSAAATPGSTVQVVEQGVLMRDNIAALPTTLRATLDSAENDYAILFD